MQRAELRELPAPLTPSDCDLRDFGWMPLDVIRLRGSDLAVLATGDGFRAAVLLWCAAWHQVPTASLPKDDRLLANLAGYGRDMKGWAAVRDEAPRIQLTRSSPNGETAHVQANQRARTESLGDIARRHAGSGISFGPRPTGLPPSASEPEGGATVRLLSEG